MNLRRLPSLSPRLRLARAWLGRLRTAGGRLGSHRESVRLLASSRADIAAQAAGLLDFGRASDQEFTALARQLSELAQRLAAVRTEAASLDLVLQGKDHDRALDSAYAVYKNSVDLVHSSIGIAVSEQEQMQQVEAGLRRVCDSASAFQRNNLVFRMLAMGIRMEAARLAPEQQGTFFNVAIAIAEIEQQMSQTSESAFERIGNVITETAAERTQLAQLQAALHERAQHSIRTIHRELEALRAALTPCAEQSTAITALLDDTTRHTGTLVTALQYQDIVRQKLEHVAQGFADLASHLGREPGVDAGYVHHAAQLQARQLAGARAEITRAADTLVRGTEALLGTSETLVERFERMQHTAAAALRGCRVAALFTEEIGKLSEIAHQSEDTNRKLAAVVDRIEQIVTIFAHDICRHQFDVKLVSLNAQIAAARLASAEALNKLAEEAIRVSAASAETTRRFTADLEVTLGQLAQIKRDAGEFLAVITREKDALQAATEVVSTKLSRLSATVESGTATILHRFSAVDGDLRELLGALHFPEQIAQAWTGPERLCTTLAMATAEAGTTTLADAARAQLDAHQRRYTMQTEHEAHIVVLPGGLAPATAPAGTSAASRGAAPAAPAAGTPTPVLTAIASATESSAAAADPADTSKPFGDGIELF